MIFLKVVNATKSFAYVVQENTISAFVFFFFFNVLLTIPLSVVVKFTSMFFSVGTTYFRDEHQMDFKWEKKFSM